jgi:hypothetical protein
MSATNADAYHFALHFRVPDDQPVHGDPGELTIAELAVGHRLALRLEGDGTAGQAKQLMLLGQGYDAEEQAAKWVSGLGMHCCLLPSRATLASSGRRRRGRLVCMEGAWDTPHGPLRVYR